MLKKEKEKRRFGIPALSEPAPTWQRISRHPTEEGLLSCCSRQSACTCCSYGSDDDHDLLGGSAFPSTITENQLCLFLYVHVSVGYQIYITWVHPELEAAASREAGGRSGEPPLAETSMDNIYTYIFSTQTRQWLCPLTAPRHPSICPWFFCGNLPGQRRNTAGHFLFPCRIFFCVFLSLPSYCQCNL